MANELSVDWLSRFSTSEVTDHHVITSSNTPGVCVCLFIAREPKRWEDCTHAYGAVTLAWNSPPHIYCTNPSGYPLLSSLPNTPSLPPSSTFIYNHQRVKRWSSAWESLGISCNLCCLNIKYRAGKPPAPATFPLHHFLPNASTLP